MQKQADTAVVKTNAPESEQQVHQPSTPTAPPDTTVTAESAALVSDPQEAAQIALDVEVRVDGGTAPKFAWCPDENHQPVFLSPSAVPHRVYQAVTDWEGDPFYHPVAGSFTVAPEGKTLEELATENSLWSFPEEA
jgi:hypothetical protein